MRMGLVKADEDVAKSATRRMDSRPRASILASSIIGSPQTPGDQPAGRQV